MPRLTKAELDRRAARQALVAAAVPHLYDDEPTCPRCPASVPNRWQPSAARPGWERSACRGDGRHWSWRRRCGGDQPERVDFQPQPWVAPPPAPAAVPDELPPPDVDVTATRRVSDGSFIWYESRRDRWRARATVDGRTRYCGSHLSREAAQAAVDAFLMQPAAETRSLAPPAPVWGGAALAGYVDAPLAQASLWGAA